MGTTTRDMLAAEYIRHWGIDVSGWLDAHPELEWSVLLQCDVCGLQFFDPLVPGDQQFYEAIMPTYVTDRWEFEEARTYTEGAVVADLGCGPGHFLDAIRPIAKRVVGNDHSAAALKRLSERGIETCLGSITEMAVRYSREFDVVTAFHLVEHLPDPIRVIEVGRAILRPGGLLILSVPNRNRAVRDRFEPLDWPPHHLTRWSKRQLSILAAKGSLAIERLAGEPTHYGTARFRRLPLALGSLAVFVDAALRGKRLRITGESFAHGGQSLLAVFRLQDEGLAE